MRKLIAIAWCIGAGLSTSGCAAVVAGGIFYDHAKSREDRAAFTADFRKQNLEREKAGLQALDWCTELYRTKASWYAEDATCKGKAVS